MIMRNYRPRYKDYYDYVEKNKSTWFSDIYHEEIEEYDE